jgi:hypothetical protein
VVRDGPQSEHRAQLPVLAGALCTLAAHWSGGGCGCAPCRWQRDRAETFGRCEVIRGQNLTLAVPEPRGKEVPTGTELIVKHLAEYVRLELRPWSRRSSS